MSTAASPLSLEVGTAVGGIQLDKSKPFPEGTQGVIQFLSTDIQCHLRYVIRLQVLVQNNTGVV